MKFLLCFIIAFLGSLLFGGDVTLEFQGNNAAGSVEYFAQRKARGADDASYVETIAGPGDPVVGSQPQRFRLVDPQVPPGRYTWRVAARIGTGADLLVSAFSAPVDGVSNPNAPEGLQIVFVGGLVNLSARARVGAGDDVVIGGFVTDRPLTLLVRGVGPSLRQFGLSSPLSRPRLSLRDSQGKELAGNAGWQDNAALAAVGNQVGAFPLLAGSADAALLFSAPAGRFTAVLDGADGASGIALLEMYLVR